ncbi:MAG: hypothetical protein HC939_15835 [Pleurocapsa sp. SU_5_0]|nr:hypothetical protein [Pleurocapsa sp. SU_5_0]NJO98296.1 hypothetical protein [Pleurocapsa sp. CRU_1_2]NJR46857.1 hypothetical protein [Hyellaceae cyanobacterium CSU_1_1]
MWSNSRKPKVVDEFVYDQGNLEPSFIVPGKEGAETGCRYKSREEYIFGLVTRTVCNITATT